MSTCRKLLQLPNLLQLQLFALLHFLGDALEVGSCLGLPIDQHGLCIHASELL